MDTNAAILQTLLQAEDEEYLSGETLAKEHGISRVAVNARIRKLKHSGIRFKAVPRRGYLLQAEPAELHPDLLEAHLHLQPNQGFDPAAVHLLEQTESTNLEVERRLGAGAEAPLAVFAKSQTQGRGRMGRAWHSTDPRNLYLSIGFRPGQSGTALASFSLWAGIRLAQTLRNTTDLPVQVKWPNDLQVGGQKIAGILCEAKLELDRVQTLVFGLGLNVNQEADTLPGNLRTPATTLRSLLGATAPIHPLAVQVLTAVLDGYQACQQPGSGQQLQQEFSTVDALFGQVVTIQNGPVETQGTAKGIDLHGNLLLEVPEGKTVPIPAGDVSLKKQPNPVTD